MNFLRRIGELLGRFYDRILAVGAVAVLIGAIAWSLIRLGVLSGEENSFSRWMSGRTPEHPEAPAVDVAPYEQAQKELENAPQSTTWSNALLVPETRCWCVDCMRPIPMTADVCPFCGVTQPEDKPPEGLDSDFDDMPDVFEKQYGLETRNSGDATMDPDGDGFTNLEECKAESDPTSTTNHPAYATKLVIGSVHSVPFKLLFKSVLQLPDGLKFQINAREGITHIVKLGDTVQGFQVVHYLPTNTVRMSAAGPLKVNTSVLTLRREGKEIPLVWNVPQEYGTETKVVLHFNLDNSDLPTAVGQDINLRNEAYKVITVDKAKETVVIQRLSDEKRFDIRKPL